MDSITTGEINSDNSSTPSRRRLLRVGSGVLAVAGLAALGIELVDHGFLPGQSLLNDLDGACQLAKQPLAFGPTGRQINGSFYSRHRHTLVKYSIGLPAGFIAGEHTALAIFLHGEGSSHRCSFAIAKSPARAVSLLVNGRALAPMAIATVDGGRHYWHRYRNDDPMAMVVNEFIPLCQSLGLGQQPGSIGAMGLSMGGYGALLFGEKHPTVFSAVAALSPAIWTSYTQARGANAVAYSSSSNFARNDVVTHAGQLAQTPTFIASGNHDPFYPGAQAFRAALATSTPLRTIFADGCHGGDFYAVHMPAALTFMSTHLNKQHA